MGEAEEWGAFDIEIETVAPPPEELPEPLPGFFLPPLWLQPAIANSAAAPINGVKKTDFKPLINEIPYK
jgi:hypothetical protein